VPQNAQKNQTRPAIAVKDDIRQSLAKRGGYAMTTITTKDGTHS
jgi:hypothetical protein